MSTLSIFCQNESTKRCCTNQNAKKWIPNSKTDEHWLKDCCQNQSNQNVILIIFQSKA